MGPTGMGHASRFEGRDELQAPPRIGLRVSTSGAPRRLRVAELGPQKNDDWVLTANVEEV